MPCARRAWARRASGQAAEDLLEEACGKYDTARRLQRDFDKAVHNACAALLSRCVEAAAERNFGQARDYFDRALARAAEADTGAIAALLARFFARASARSK